jgi:hypothetical protein
VDEDHHVVDAATLQSLAPGQRHMFTLDCDGHSEGHYHVTGSVQATAVTGAFSNGIPWRRYRVVFDELRCIKESDWDRFTTSDEPFVLGLVIPHGGLEATTSWRTGPFTDVDTGETRSIGRSFDIRVAQRYGFLTLACAVYESDDETPNDRDALLADFARGIGSGIVQADSSFLEVVAASVASGWRPASVDAVAFNRAPTAAVRAYRQAVFNRWVDGGDQVQWTLVEAASHDVPVPDRIDGGPDCTQVKIPGANPDTKPVDFGRKPGDRPAQPGDDLGVRVAVDLSVLHAVCRPPAAGDDDGTIDEATPAPRPGDGC